MSNKKNQKEQKGISRREFMKGMGTGAAVVAGAVIAQPFGCATTAQGTAFGPKTDPTKTPRNWDLEADVVIIGSGAVGLPAAIRAQEAGASVIIVDCNYDIGGHAITSGGNCPLGGGTSYQKKYGIQDDPDTYFKDLTDWSVVEVSGLAEYRYNDRGVQRALADNSAPAFEFLLAEGADFVDRAPDNSGAHATGISARREHHTVWTQGQSAESPAGAGGTGLMRPLELSARQKGVKFLLNYHMDVIFRESVNSGRVLGIEAHYTPTILPGTTTPLQSFRSEGNITLSAETVTVKANKAIVVATGGSTGNVEFRRIFDPRLTEEYALAADEYSPQDASGELASMAIGASLWGTANQTMDRNGSLRKRPIIATRTNYINWTPASPLFPKIKYTGLSVRNWQDAIIVNQAGRRFYNEMQDGYPNGTAEGFYRDFDGYVHGDWRNAKKINYNPMNYTDAALAINEGSTAPDFASGPQWAIFDSEAATRERWNFDPPATDPNLFFSANTLAELAEKLSTCTYQKYRMPGNVLEATVREYNSFVDTGVDSAFDKPKPLYKIAAPPFYAAWATFAIHDTYAGLRINMKCQVQDISGQVIPGLYCGGESAGGCSQHGLARCLTQGYIIGKEVVSN
jgi:succinate dehydrogenase/fumarate reductase flavoprotein subunit